MKLQSRRLKKRMKGPIGEHGKAKGLSRSLSSLERRPSMGLLCLRNVQRAMETVMRSQRRTESLEERHVRRIRGIQTKKDEAAAREDIVDRMIRMNIEQFGP